MIEQHLEQTLNEAFKPSYLSVTNESDQHAGSSTQSHFKIIVVSEKFIDLPLLERHRFINRLLKETLTKIHALAMHTYTPLEWQRKKSAPQSPKCHNSH